jgi:hypothetical protein
MIRPNVFLPLALAVFTLAPLVAAQEGVAFMAVPGPATEDAALPDAPLPTPQDQAPGYEGKQTRRILGIVPNFRSVSVDEKLPPISAHEKLKLTLEDSFDYSSFIYVGMLAGVSQAEGSYPEFHTGAPAYARYYWHGFADDLNGNLMTEFILPVATKEDPRYYTLGRGGVFKRTGYSVSRLFITRTDSGGASPNFSEIVGNGAAAGISGLYYPSRERTWTKTGQRWAAQVGLDGFSDLVKEFWPDVNARLFHNKY